MNDIIKKMPAFVSKIIITTVIYLALLFPFQNIQPVHMVVEHSLQGFLPIVLGIFWGLPAAIGVFVGNFLYDPSPIFLFIYISNGLSALCARRLFYASWNHSLIKGMYIYNLQSLANFIYTVLLVKLSFSCSITALYHLYYNSESVFQFFQVVFLNNLQSNIFIGIPVMLFLPLLNKWADIPEKSDGNQYSHGFATANIFLILSIPITLFIVRFFDEPNFVLQLLLLLPIFGATLSARPTPTVEINPAFYGFHSLSYQLFMWMMIISIILSIVLSFIILFPEFFYGNCRLEVIPEIIKLFRISLFVALVMLLTFALMLRVVRKNFLNPIQNIASKLSIAGEDYKNELDIISKRLNFIASSNTELLSNDEYSIIIGLTTKDYSKRFSLKEARDIINDICLKYVSGYISSVDGVGGYKGDDYSGMEQMLIYTIYGASDEQICKIADDVIKSLSQESVLIEKNKISHYYFYGS